MNLRASIVIGCLAAACAAQAQYAGPAQILVSDGGDVTAQVVQWTGSPGDLDLFYYVTSDSSTYIGANNAWEDDAPPVDLGTIPAGDEVEIGFFNTDTETWFYTGPAGRNPDDDIHAILTNLGDDEVRVDFEDLASYQGSDFNYGDGSIVVSGVTAENATPGPAALGVFAASGIGLLRRRFKK